MQTPETLIRFDRLRERLLQGGVARRHIKRVLTELSDHYDDALRAEHAAGLSGAEAAARAWERLGSEDEIVVSTLAHLELRALPARFPRTISVVGPLALWFGAFAGSMMLFAGTLKVLEVTGVIGTPFSVAPLWVKDVANAAMFFYMRILPIVIGAGVAVVFARRRLVPVWTIAGAVAISVLTALSTYSVIFTNVAGHSGSLGVGLQFHGAQDVPKMALYAALILAAYFLARRRRAA